MWTEIDLMAFLDDAPAIYHEWTRLILNGEVEYPKFPTDAMGNPPVPMPRLLREGPRLLDLCKRMAVTPVPLLALPDENEGEQYSSEEWLAYVTSDAYAADHDSDAEAGKEG